MLRRLTRSLIILLLIVGCVSLLKEEWVCNYHNRDDCNCPPHPTDVDDSPKFSNSEDCAIYCEKQNVMIMTMMK